MTDSLKELQKAAQRKPSIGQTAIAVLCAFFGVRKNKAHQRDLAQLNPVHLIVIGIIFAALFVGILLIIVRFAISQASAF